MSGKELSERQFKQLTKHQRACVGRVRHKGLERSILQRKKDCVYHDRLIGTTPMANAFREVGL